MVAGQPQARFRQLSVRTLNDLVDPNHTQFKPRHHYENRRAANDDRQPARTISEILPKYGVAKVPIEVHLFTKGGHAFNMSNHSRLVTVKGWTNRLADWLADNVLVTEPVVTANSLCHHSCEILSSTLSLPRC